MDPRIAIFIIAAGAATAAAAASPAGIASDYGKAAAAAPSAARGQEFFTATHGREWSCATCHGKQPVGQGRHATTGKPIAPLAPAANAERLTDAAKVEKWLRRNCNDVAGRECSAQEKADITAWLAGIKP